MASWNHVLLFLLLFASSLNVELNSQRQEINVLKHALFILFFKQRLQEVIWSERSHFCFFAFICTLKKISKTQIVCINKKNSVGDLPPSSIVSSRSRFSCRTFASFHPSWLWTGSRKRPPCSCWVRTEPFSDCFVIGSVTVMWCYTVCYML